MTLQEYLKAGHATQARLCRITGISRQTMWRLANEDRIPTMVNAALIHLATEGRVTFMDWLEEPPELQPLKVQRRKSTRGANLKKRRTKKLVKEEDK